MFIKSMASLCAAAALLATQAVRADDTKAGGDDSGLFYAGIGASRIGHDFNNVGAPVNLNFISGVRIPTIDWISAELAGSATVIPGKNDNQGGGILGKICIGGVVGDTCDDPGDGDGDGGGQTPQERDDLTTFDIGLYLALRSPGRFYVAGKVGYRYLQTSFVDELYDERSGAAWSAGLGWRWGDSLSGVEALYTGYGGGLDAISLGVVYGFGGR